MFYRTEGEVTYCGLVANKISGMNLCWKLVWVTLSIVDCENESLQVGEVLKYGYIDTY